MKSNRSVHQYFIQALGNEGLKCDAKYYPTGQYLQANIAGRVRIRGSAIYPRELCQAAVGWECSQEGFLLV